MNKLPSELRLFFDTLVAYNSSNTSAAVKIKRRNMMVSAITSLLRAVHTKIVTLPMLRTSLRLYSAVHNVEAFTVVNALLPLLSYL